MTLVSRELVRPVAAPKPEMHKLSKINPQRDRNAYLCKLSREIWVTVAPLFRSTADNLPRGPDFLIVRQVSTVNSPGGETHAE